MSRPAIVCLALLPQLGWAAAMPPRLEVRGGHWSNGTVSIDVSVWHPLQRSGVGQLAPLLLGGPHRGFCDGLTVEVLSADGTVQKWPWEVPYTCLEAVTLTENHGGAKTFRLAPADVAAIAPGTYEVRVKLDLANAGGGDFQGVVTSTPRELDMGEIHPGESRSTDSVPELVAAIDRARTEIARRELALRLEPLMLDGEELGGATVDRLVARHLEELTQQMCTAEDVYSTEAGSRRRNDVLFAHAVWLSPGRVSASFRTRLKGTPKGQDAREAQWQPIDVPVAVAANARAFWGAVQERKEPGIHVYPVHSRGGVVRVATELVLPVLGPEWYQYISYWAGSGTSWRLLSFDPVPPDFEWRQWHANVHRSGAVPRTPSELTAEERAQWLEARLDMLRLMTLSGERGWMGGATSLDGFFERDVIDASYVPLLKRRQNAGPLEEQAAVLIRLVHLEAHPPVESMLDLYPRIENPDLKGALMGAAWHELEPRLQREGRAATEPEHDAIAASVPPGFGRGEVKVVGDFAVHFVGAYECAKTLFRKVEGRWKLLATLGGCIE